MSTESPRIRLLADEVARQIAAGEVVERPSAVVKELTENAIDAGSTAITVEIVDGGKQAIRVSDNGCGMAAEDIPLAFTRHATSKLFTLEDLSHIDHMGFRGEALYSIAAVAKVELITKRAQDDFGVKVENNGGVLGEPVEAGCPDGTTVWVRDLFYNTPARQKFLRSALSETKAIDTVVSHLILANPGISFRFIVNGKTVYRSQGDGNLRNAIFSVLGKEIAAHMVEVSGQESGVVVEGFVGEPIAARGNRALEMLYVNGRPVNHAMISKAVENAYGTTLMSQKFPVFVLNLKIPYEWVDVNVHPNKLQVRFADDQRVFYAVMTCVRRALAGVEQKPIVMTFAEPEKPKASAAPVAVPKAEPAKPAAAEPERKPEPRMVSIPEPAAKPEAKPAEPKPAPSVPEKKPAVEAPKPDETRQTVQSALRAYREQALQEQQTPFSYRQKLAEKKPVLHNEESIPLVQPAPAQQEMADVRLPEGELRGVVFDTYALVECGEDLYIVDQHAAHERLLYDEYSRRVEEGSVISQQLLVPQTLEVTYYQKNTVEENLEMFTRLGYELEPFGRSSYQIRAVPVFMGQAQQSSFFLELLDMLNSQQGNHRDERQRAVMQMSCKGAVKGGEPLTKEEMQNLLAILRKEDSPLSCPHGRPICVKLTRRELEKQFKRIV